MKHRDYKQLTQGTFYHVFNRGTAKSKIFLDKEDYALFLSRLREYLYPEEVDRAELAKKHLYVRSQLPSNAFELVSYCLMPNHFHFLLLQKTELPVSKLISRLCTSYSKVFNHKYKRVGALFQDQFKAVPIESNEQLLWVSEYIHHNPLKAGLVKDLSAYPYSSYPDYVGTRAGTLCKKEFVISQCGGSPASYRQSLVDFEEGSHIPLMLDAD